MRVVWLPLLAVLTAAGAGCAPSEPPRWAQGGARLVLPAAHWHRGGDNDVEIKPNGQVLEDGELVFLIDVVGRVVDDNFEPVALLFPDGSVAGTDNYALGHVGISNAAPPGRATAWLAVRPDGSVLYFDEDGERRAGGQWRGCTPPALRTCTLVTHMFAVRDFVRYADSGVSIGVGVGVGVGY